MVRPLDKFTLLFRRVPVLVRGGHKSVVDLRLEGLDVGVHDVHELLEGWRPGGVVEKAGHSLRRPTRAHESWKDSMSGHAFSWSQKPRARKGFVTNEGHECCTFGAGGNQHKLMPNIR